MNSRLLSIDVLRGMTIFFMIIVNTPGSWNYVYSPLLHAKWHGCTPTDLVFPSFLFVVGLSMAISLSKNSGKDNFNWLTKVLKRGFIIFLIGLLLNWFPFYHKSFVDLRFFGVLQRIALAFLGAGIILSVTKKKVALIISTLFLLLLHWAILYFLGGDDPYSLENHVGRLLDVSLIGENHVYGGFGMPFDPEGLLGTLSSIGQVLIGYLVGMEVIRKDLNIQKKIKQVLLFGIASIFIGQLWGIIYPINKPMWTGSYVLYTVGILSVLLSVLMWILDFKKWERWSFVFKVFGRNPLVSYILSMVIVKIFITVVKIGDSNLYSWLYNNVYQNLFGKYFGSLMFAISVTLLVWLLALALYRKGKIIRV